MGKVYVIVKLNDEPVSFLGAFLSKEKAEAKATELRDESCKYDLKYRAGDCLEVIEMELFA